MATFPPAPPIAVTSFTVHGTRPLPELSRLAGVDARTFAEQNDVPLAVAIAGMRLQSVWSRTADRIRIEHGDRYLAAGRDPAGTSAWISFVTEPGDEILRGLARMPVPITVHVTHGLTNDQLDAVTGAAMRILLDSGEVHDGESGGDPVTRAVVIHYNPSSTVDAARLEADARRAADMTVGLEVGPWLAFSRGTAGVGRRGVHGSGDPSRRAAP